MADIRELYQEIILDHNRRPRNFHKLEGANRVAEGYNPLCGDKVIVYLKVEDDLVRDLSFQGTGCAISIASASLMTQSVKGKSLHWVQRLFDGFHELVTGTVPAVSSAEELGKLSVFAGVLEFPTRVKCATLPWHTLHAALVRVQETVTTE